MPGAFLKDDRSSFCPHHRDAATIVVIADDRAAQLSPPFGVEVHAVLLPCAELRARDPDFAACRVEP